MGITMHVTPRLRLFVLFLLLSVIWGSEFVAIKFALDTTPPLSLAGLRYLLAGSVLFLFTIAWRGFSLVNARLFLVSVFLGFFATMEFGFLYFGMQHVAAGVATILFYTQPVMVAMLAAIFLDEPFTGKKTLAVASGFLGIILIFGEYPSDGLFGLGAFLVLLGALGYALGTIAFKRLVRSEDLLLISSILFLTCGVFLFSVGTLFEPSSLVITPELALILAYLVVAGSALGLPLWFYLLRHYEASQVSPYLFLVPVFGVLLGWSLLDETLYPSALIGIFLVALSIYILNK